MPARTAVALELAGFACVVVAASLVHVALAWLAAGVGLLLKSFELDAHRRGA